MNPRRPKPSLIVFCLISIFSACTIRHPPCVDPATDGKLTGTLCCIVTCSPDGKVEIQTGWWYAGYQCILDKVPPITIDCLHEFDKMCDPAIGCPP